jgi:hypothetical protein
MVVEGRCLGVHGGVKIYRGNPAAARAYVEADRSRADDYYGNDRQRASVARVKIVGTVWAP